MKKLLYGVILLPIFLTGATFCWVLSGELKFVKAMNVPLPQIGEPTSQADEKVRSGQEVFNAKGCVYCHGLNGAGGVKNNNAQGGEIPSLTKVAEGYSLDELKTRILSGVNEIGREDPNGPVPPLYMPSWKGHLTDSELDAVAAFLISLAPKEKGADDF